MNAWHEAHSAPLQAPATGVELNIPRSDTPYSSSGDGIDPYPGFCTARENQGAGSYSKAKNPRAQILSAEAQVGPLQGRSKVAPKSFWGGIAITCPITCCTKYIPRSGEPKVVLRKVQGIRHSDLIKLFRDFSSILVRPQKPTLLQPKNLPAWHQA